ncbi:MAG: glucosamine-6-phosphate deaminase [Bacillota bacterium]
MNIIVVNDYHEMSQQAARILAGQLHDQPRSVLGLATGGTPVGMYRELVRMHQQGSLSFSQASSFNLDEYVGLGADHPCSYRYFMAGHLFDQVNMPSDRVHIPNGLAMNLNAECQAYEAKIAVSGPIDLQVLGIGHNGHIGFNEPGTPFASRTHLVGLTERTIAANARYFSSAAEVPTRAISMGISTIMDARRILLLASGADKAEIIAAALYGSVSEAVPASILQRHPSVTCILDRAAASRLAIPRAAG